MPAPALPVEKRRLKLSPLCSCPPQADPRLYLGQTGIRSGNEPIFRLAFRALRWWLRGQGCTPGEFYLNHLQPGCPRPCRSHTGGTGATRLGTAFLGSLRPSLLHSGDSRGSFPLSTGTLLVFAVATPALPSPEVQTLHSSGSQGPLHRPLSQTQLHPSTCLPGGPLSCRLNISLMAISCLNMSCAKPLCEYPENKWLPAGTTAMPPLQSISYGCLICFPSLLCLQSAHLLSRSEGFTPSWTKGNGLCYMAEENPQSCFPFPPCSISPGYPKARPSLQSHVCSPSQPTPQCLGSANA